MSKKRPTWDQTFMELADVIAKRSKDPSTQVGAVVVNKDRVVLSMGYNGFPRGVLDNEELYNNRELKYKYISHAEQNALDFAETSLKGCVIYVSAMPGIPCTQCTKSIIQKGLSEVVVKSKRGTDIPDRWVDDFNISKEMFMWAGIRVRSLDGS